MSKSSTLGRVAFQRCDNHSKKNIEVVEKVAEHFKVYRSYFKGIFNLIVLSRRWYPEDGDYDFEEFNKWKKKFECGNEVQDKKNISDIIEEGFNDCVNYQDFHTLRGLLFEAMLIGLHGGKSILQEDNVKYGWGCQVIVLKDGKLEIVDYQCQLKKEHTCKSRLTIDFAYWDNESNSGEFYECKVTPNKFTCKEDNYMHTLQEAIQQINGNAQYFLAAPHPARKFKYTCEVSEDVGIFGAELFKDQYVKV